MELKNTQYYLLKHGPTHVFQIYIVINWSLGFRFPRIFREEKIHIWEFRVNNSVIKVYGDPGKSQEDE